MNLDPYYEEVDSLPLKDGVVPKSAKDGFIPGEEVHEETTPQKSHAVTV